MKKVYLLSCVAALLLTVSSCKDDVIGQTPVDGVAPACVTDVQVDNQAGKSVLTYKLPNETDLLYVKAVYEDSNGNKKEVKSSVFKNQMELVGFGKSAKHTIQLYSVDRSQNESKPVDVDIQPLDSPIYEVANSLNVVDSWGGAKIFWSNSTEADVKINVSLKDSDNVYKSYETFYTNVKDGVNAIRGLDSIPQHLAVVISDTYSNSTDTLFKDIKPLYEMELPGKDFSVLPLPTGYVLSIWGGPFSRLFDGITGSSANAYYMDTTNPTLYHTPYFSFDMKKTYKLSRIRLWGRVGNNFEFSLHNLRYFQIWGTNDESCQSEPDDWTRWTKIRDCESIIPSGNDNKHVTSADKAYYAQGEEYEFDIQTPPYRFLRIISTENWSMTPKLHIIEMKIWGSEVK